MSVFFETSLGDIVIDLHIDKAPKACFNFIKLCQMKFYNNSLFHSVQKDYICETGKPVNGLPPTSIWGLLSSERAKPKFFGDEICKAKFNRKGLVATGNVGPNMNSSTFFITLSNDKLDSFYKKHTIFGEVVEGLDVLDKINLVYVNQEDRPLQNIRIKHSMVIEDPYEEADSIA